MKIFNQRGNTLGIVIVIGILFALGILAYFQFLTTPVYVVKQPIEMGTKITEEMLSDGLIEVKEMSKSLVTPDTITNFREIEGQYVKNTLREGKIIFDYDIADKYDLRNNDILKAYDLEAVNIQVENLGLSDNVGIGDKINIYGIYTYDISSLFENKLEVSVANLNPELKQIFIENGYKDTDLINSQTITISKLLLQNVPVVETFKEEETKKLTSVTLGVEPEHAEVIALSSKTGSLAATVLPYSEDDYQPKETKGAVSFLELNTKGVINDLKPAQTSEE